MKKISIVLVLVLFVLFTSRAQEKSKLTVNNPVDNVKLDSDILTPEALWSLGRVSGVTVSPDNSTILFGASFYNIDENNGNRELFVLSTDGGEVKNITLSEKGEYEATWRADGEKIGYLSGA